jgi:ribosome-binding factor A
MSKRTLQVGEAIREHLALMLARGEISDPRVRNVTLNSVKVSPDLQLARIYYSVLGEESVRKGVHEGLKNAAGFMRRSLGEALKMRYTPVLNFHYDESIQRAARMVEVFAGIERERKEHGSTSEISEKEELDADSDHTTESLPASGRK